MGLFSFLKNAGSKVLTKKATAEATSPEIKKLEAELFRKQKLILLKGVVTSSGVKVTKMDMDLIKDDTIIISGKVKNQEAKEKLVLALGNVGGIAKVNAQGIVVSKEAPEAKFYTVKKGDTLGKIAKAHYGDAKKYKQIFEANTPMLKNPNRIYPGQKLRIPAL